MRRYLLPAAALASLALGLLAVQVTLLGVGQARNTQLLCVAIATVGLALVTFFAMRALSQQRALVLRYERLAKVDTLTGLANRFALEQRMAERLALASRMGRGLGVMFIDVDDFKNINDSLGHSAGDEVLREVAERMRRALRESDLIARYSGDEFVVLASNIDDPRHLAGIAAKLLESVSAVIAVLGNELFVTLSIGIVHSPSDGMDVPTLLKHADAAMYRAKEKGKNGFEFFAAEMNVAALEKLHLNSSLWQALNRHEFIVYFQPKADALTGRIVGFEALVRWNHPEFGLLLPGRFIPHAENSGAIEPLGEWVLGAALAQLRAWRDAGDFDGTMAVNLSMRQLYNPGLPATVQRLLVQHGVRPGQLELEVTESMVSLRPELASRILAELKALGVSIALDDFGTGQSSLAYLLRFPINTIKIDRSFTEDIPQCEDACAVVRSVILLGRSLRMRLVAEGVESPSQRVFYRQEGCDEIQGFLVGMPMPAREAGRLLSEESRHIDQRRPIVAERDLLPA